MDNRLIELGKRAVGCERWRWMPGMACWFPADGWTFDGVKVERPERTYRVKEHPLTPNGRSLMMHGECSPLEMCTPDLTDPATLGCLLALVREVHEVPRLFVRWEREGLPSEGGEVWAVVYLPMTREEVFARDEVEALVIALERAPKEHAEERE